VPGFPDNKLLYGEATWLRFNLPSAKAERFRREPSKPFLFNGKNVEKNKKPVPGFQDISVILEKTGPGFQDEELLHGMSSVTLFSGDRRGELLQRGTGNLFAVLPRGLRPMISRP
jgi:hypothetical protein